MNLFAHIVLLGFVPLAVALFALVPVRSAILLTTIGGFLFLPVMSIPFPGLFDLTKYNAIAIALLLGTMVARQAPRTRIQWNLVDACVGMWIASALASAVANGLSLTAIVRDTAMRGIEWGVVYWTGRRYFATRAQARQLLTAIFLGGLVYVPLCFYEVRMSPQLHTKLYGMFQHSFDQMVRVGGYRPIVFTDHGLQVALWMAAVTLAGLALLRHRCVPRVFGAPAWLLVTAVVSALLLCRSLGSLLITSAFSSIVWRRQGRPILLVGVLSAVFGYLVFRMVADPVFLSIAEYYLQFAPEERAGSARFRFESETMFLEHAWKQPWVGWTAMHMRPDFVLYEWEGPPQQVTDSLWIIVFLINGLFGLTAFYGMFLAAGLCLLLPSLRNLGKRGGFEFHVLAVLTTAWAIDSLVNGQSYPPILLGMGAISGAAAGSLHEAQELRGPSRQASAADGRRIAPLVARKAVPGQSLLQAGARLRPRDKERSRPRADGPMAGD